MSRTLRVRITLSVLGALFVLAAPFWNAIFSGIFQALPDDFSFQAELVSVDIKNEGDADLEEDVYGHSVLRYDTLSANDGVIEIRQVLEGSIFGEEEIQIEDVHAFDQSTGKHIPAEDHEHVHADGYLFAPRGLREGEGFLYYNVIYDQGVDMRYVETQRRHGIDLFQYEGTLEYIAADKQDKLVYLPNQERQEQVRVFVRFLVWVEPTTGRFVDYEEETWFAPEGDDLMQSWKHLQHTYEQATVDFIADQVSRQRTEVLLIQIFIPAALLILGLVLIAVGNSVFDRFQRVIGLKSTEITAVVIALLAIFPFFGFQWASDSLWSLLVYSSLDMLTAAAFLCIALVMFAIGRQFRRAAWILIVPVLVVGVVYMLGGMFQLPLAVLETSRFKMFILGGGLLLVPLLFASLLLSKRLQSIKHVIEILVSLLFVVSLLSATHVFFASAGIGIFALFDLFPSYTSFLFLMVSLGLYIQLHKVRLTLLPFRYWLMIGTAFCVLLTLAIPLAKIVKENILEQERRDFLSEVDKSVNALSEIINDHRSVLGAIDGFFASSDTVEPDEWQTFVSALQAQSMVNEFEEVGYALCQAADGIPLACPVEYAFPSSTTQGSIGLDLLASPAQKAAVLRANRSKTAVLSKKVDQWGTHGSAMVFVLKPSLLTKQDPVFLEEDEIESQITLHYIIVELDVFQNQIRSLITEKWLNMRIYDGPTTDGDLILNTQGEMEMEEETQLFQETRRIFLLGRPWTVVFTAELNAEEREADLIEGAIVAISLFVALLLAFLLYVMSAARAQAVQYANKLTKDLRHEQAKTEAVLLSIADGVIATDADGTIMLVNDAAQRMLGESEKNLVGQLKHVRIPLRSADGQRIPDDRQLLTRALRQQKIQKSDLEGLQYSRADRSTFPVSVSAAPILHDGELVGAVEIFRDITREREIDKAKTEFVSLASHQLRTPLSAVNWYTEALADGDLGKLKGEQKEYVEHIRKSNKRMTALVNALLNVSRIEMGTFAITKDKINVRETMQGALEDLQLLAEEKGVQLKISVSKGRKYMEGDPKLLQIIVQNLVSNAVKYTPKGGKINCTVKFTKGHMQLQVKDTGYGIPKEAQKKIFTKLFRAENVQEKKIEGTGLGLYIIKSIVEEIGGEISFTSREGKGTTFTVRLPLSGAKEKKGEKGLVG